MKVAVLGASGFVGSAVCSALGHRGHEVLPLRAPRVSLDPSGDVAAQLHAVDVADFTARLAGVDVVVNCAGNPDASSRDEAALYGANAALPTVAARAAHQAGCRRFVHISSAVVQGSAPELNDRPPPRRGFSVYADSKVQGERLLEGLPAGFVVTYRPPSVHAPGRRITRSLAALSSHHLGIVAGDGSAPSPQALLPNVGDAIAFLATTTTVPPPVVIHPWEGRTTASLLTDLGGRRPWHVPAPPLRVALAAGLITSRCLPQLGPHVRRAELMMFGQRQASSWLTSQGWLPPVAPEAWTELAAATSARRRSSPTPRAMIVTSVASMVDQFNLPNIRLLLESGVQVEVASNFEEGNTISAERIMALQRKLQGWGVTWHQVDFSRSPHALGRHVQATRQLDAIVRSSRPDFIHCHSPIGGAITRVVARRHRIPCVYTAHGFHFSSGAPLKNWLTYYPLERLLGPLTHTVVTINDEDTRRARRMGASHVLSSPGVGVDIAAFERHPAGREDARRMLGLSQRCTCLLSVGELNDNKNHQVVLHALSHLADLDVHYLVCGQGPARDSLEALTREMGIAERVTFLGYREDIKDLYAAADLVVFPSRREGLPVSLIEAMASGLPIVASRIRGVTDLLGASAEEALVDPAEPRSFARAIRRLAEDPQRAGVMGERNAAAARAYSVQAAMAAIAPTYRELIQPANVMEGL